MQRLELHFILDFAVFDLILNSFNQYSLEYKLTFRLDFKGT